MYFGKSQRKRVDMLSQRQMEATILLYYLFRLQATNSSARPDVSIEQSQGFQTVRCLIGC